MLAEVSLEGVSHWKILVIMGTVAVSMYGAIFALWRFIYGHINNSSIHFSEDNFVKVEVCFEIQKRMDEREAKQDERHKKIEGEISEIKGDVRDGFKDMKRLIEKHHSI